MRDGVAHPKGSDIPNKSQSAKGTQANGLDDERPLHRNSGDEQRTDDRNNAKKGRTHGDHDDQGQGDEVGGC